MSRKSTRLTLRLNAAQSAALDQLLVHGLFGHNRTDVAMRLLDEAFRARQLEGWLASPRRLRLRRGGG